MRIPFVALSCTLLATAHAWSAPDVAEGRKLVEEKRCEACHQGKVPGAVGAIYLREGRKVQSWEKLKSQVALCNSELNLSLFPDEEEHVSEFLDRTYYKFRK